MSAITGTIAADYPRHSCDELFALASDIEHYPRFLPWCKSARVIRTGEGGIREVDNHFGAGPADLAFRSRAIATPPERLEISSADGPFHRFTLVWSFTPRAEGGCRVRAEYLVEFRSGMLQALARLAVHQVERSVLRRFRDRAQAVYSR